MPLPYSESVARTILILPALLAVLACSSASETPPDQLAREEAFEQSMRGVALVGNFTVFQDQEGADEGSGEAQSLRLRSDRYEIEKVVKRAGDIWTFHARIRFGENDVTVPVPVKLVWADDTPMVSVTDLGIPGLGTYTARVIFHRDSYAGMWWGKRHGGNMFGTIERLGDQ